PRRGGLRPARRSRLASRAHPHPKRRADVRVCGFGGPVLVDSSLLAAPRRRNQHDVVRTGGAPITDTTWPPIHASLEDFRVTWLTQQTFDRLNAELEERRGPLRAEIVERISSARDEGDLKENGGYHAAKDEQGTNEARIRQLEEMLSGATTKAAD